MKGFDKLRIKSAVKSHNKMKLHQVHLTSLDFGQIVPLYHRYLVPGDKFSISANYFSRLAPLVKPTYGKFSFRTAAMFVPFHQVAFDADAFISGKTVFEGMTPDIRYITYHDFVMFFYQAAISTAVTATDAYDFMMTDAGGYVRYRKLTNYGRFCYKVLCSLGYTFPQNVDLQSSSDWYTAFNDKKLNVLPLLCFFKAYNDYMSQSQRFNTSAITTLLRYIKYNQTYTSYYDAGTRKITTLTLTVLFANLKLGYENDYFTSAWQQPENPINSVQDISSINGVNSDVISHSASTTNLTQTFPNTISQRSIDLLKTFYNFVKRNNYAGSRDVQQVFARYGIKSEDFDTNFAHLITTDVQPISVGDVTAQAQSTNVPLGDYAGKGIMQASKDITYHSSDFGMIVILGWMTVTPMYPYGFEREVLKTDPLEFYQPDFDGVGVDAISFGEVFSNCIPDSADTSLDNAVFGFTERYNDYRYARDQITGDFRSLRNLSDMNVWHTGRLLNDVRKNGDMIAQSSSMNTLAPNDSEFNRIFSITSGDVDHFYLTCQFNVIAFRPMLSLNQVPGLGEGDTVVNRNGNEVV